MTRIIAGTAGGRTLRTPPGLGHPAHERPGPRGPSSLRLDARDALRGARVLDLYAGSGALGLEAASAVEPPRSSWSSPTAGRPTSSPATRASSACPASGSCAAPWRRTWPPTRPPTRPPTSCSSTRPTTSTRPPSAAVLDRLRAGWLAPGGLLVVERSTRSPEPAWPDGIQRATQTEEVRRDHGLVRHPRLSRRAPTPVVGHVPVSVLSGSRHVAPRRGPARSTSSSWPTARGRSPGRRPDVRPRRWRVRCSAEVPRPSRPGWPSTAWTSTTPASSCSRACASTWWLPTPGRQRAARSQARLEHPRGPATDPRGGSPPPLASRRRSSSSRQPSVARGRSGAVLGHNGRMSEIDEIPRPTSGDVLERILQDHELFEDLLRRARRNDVDRAAARQALAEVLVAHATAEEEKVYPSLRRAQGHRRARGGARRGGARRDHRGAAGVPEGQGHRHPEVRRRARGARDGGEPPFERGGADDHQPGPRGRLARAPRGARGRVADPAQPAARAGVRERGAGRRAAARGGRRGRARSRGGARGGRRRSRSEAKEKAKEIEESAKQD